MTTVLSLIVVKVYRVWMVIRMMTATMMIVMITRATRRMMTLYAGVLRRHQPGTHLAPARGVHYENPGITPETKKSLEIVIGLARRVTSASIYRQTQATMYSKRVRVALPSYIFNLYITMSICYSTIESKAKDFAGSLV